MKKTTDELMGELLSKEDSMEHFFERNGDEMVSASVGEYLNGLLETRGLSRGDVIRDAQIEKSYGYQIFKGTRANPSRDNLLCLAFAMRLEVNETQKLLRIARFSMLYPRIRRDSLILRAMADRKDLIDCDQLLEQFGERPLVKKV